MRSEVDMEARRKRRERERAAGLAFSQSLRERLEAGRIPIEALVEPGPLLMRQAPPTRRVATVRRKECPFCAHVERRVRGAGLGIGQAPRSIIRRYRGLVRPCCPETPRRVPPGGGGAS